MSTLSALISWLAKTINQQNLTTQTYCNPEYFHRLALEIPDLSLPDLNPMEGIQQWQRNYTNLKNIYTALQNYYKQNLDRSFPVGLPSINLLEMAKKIDLDGYETLLIIFLIACIHSAQRQKFVTSILDLDEQYQGELMNLIQQKSMEPSLLSQPQQQPSSQINKQQLARYIQQENNKNQVDHLCFRIQSLQAENDSLNLQMNSLQEQLKKMKQSSKKVQDENRKLRRQLDEKTLYIQQKQQQQQEEQSTNQVISESNEEIIKQLKKQLLQQETKNLQKITQIKQQKYLLQEQLEQARDRIAEFESEDLISTVSRKVHHKDCVSINQHKNTTNKLQLKLKAKEHKEIEMGREVIRLKHEIEELSRKIKKEQKEKENVKEELRKNQNRGQMINSKTAGEIRMFVLEKLRDNLKTRVKQIEDKEQKLQIFSNKEESQ